MYVDYINVSLWICLLEPFQQEMIDGLDMSEELVTAPVSWSLGLNSRWLGAVPAAMHHARRAASYRAGGGRRQ